MQTAKSHFWVGRFNDDDLFFDFFGEDERIYESGNEDLPLSKFIASQGETWIDHDFMESGFESPGDDLKKQFANYSYADTWGMELEKRCAAMNLKDINALVMLDEDQLENPVSVKGPGFTLTYLGVIEYTL